MAHWCTLAAAFLYLLWLNRHQWFDTDQWDFLVERSVLGGHGTQGLLQPHTDHWSTIPILVFRGLFSLFGVRTYLPYITVTILVSLLIAHLLWRLLLRIGVSPWFAVAAAGLFAVLGVGWADLISAFQWQLIGPLATGFAALLVSAAPTPPRHRDVAVVALLVLGLLFSGVGPIMVVVVALAVALDRGIRDALRIAVVPAVIYAIWYLAYGRQAHLPGTLPLHTAVQQAPNFMWQGFQAAVDGATGLAGIAAVLLVLLAIWLVRHARPTDDPWPLVLAPAAGAPLFLFLTALKRGGLGVEHAQDSRYTYIVVALLLPAAALALDHLLRHAPLRGALIALGAALLLVVQLSTLHTQANISAQITQERKHRILGAAVLADQHATVLSPFVVPIVDPNLTYHAIGVLARDGKLPGNVTATPADVLTARAYLQVSLEPTPQVAHPGPAELVSVDGALAEPVPGGDCTTYTPQTDQPTLVVHAPDAAVIPMRAGYGGPLSVSLRTATAAGRPVVLRLPANITRYLSAEAVPADLVLGLPPTGPTTVCGLTPIPTGTH